MNLFEFFDELESEQDNCAFPISLAEDAPIWAGVDSWLGALAEAGDL